MTYTNSTRAIEKLAAGIGENVYIDVAKWHLYLADAHLHTQLAEKLYPMLDRGMPGENEVIQVLKGISVNLGGGKLSVALSDLLPTTSVKELMQVLEDFQQDL